jgi:REP element-mobilizing transposase RayT
VLRSDKPCPGRPGSLYPVLLITWFNAVITDKVVFAADENFQFYLEYLTELKGELDVRLYAYCLMTNHVHLLLMPAQGQTLASWLKALAGRQTRYVNCVEGVVERCGKDATNPAP